MKSRRVRAPPMTRNANHASISNTLYWPFCNHIPCTEKDVPDKRGIVSQHRLHEGARGEIPSLVHSVKQGVSLLSQPACLLSQHCEIKSMNVSKPHSTSILRSAQPTPVDPVYLPLVSSLPHQYLAKVKFIPSHTALGILKMLMK